MHVMVTGCASIELGGSAGSCSISEFVWVMLPALCLQVQAASDNDIPVLAHAWPGERCEDH